MESHHDLHLVVGGDWRRLSYHSQPWHGSVDRAAASVGAQPTAIPGRSDLQRSHYSFSVLAVSANWRDAVRVLSYLSADRGLHQDGYNLSDVCCLPYAGWYQRAFDCGDSCGGHVQLERGAEFAFLDHHRRFLYAFSSRGDRGAPRAAFPDGDGVVDLCVVRTSARCPSWWQGSRNGAVDRLGGLRSIAGSLSSGRPDTLRIGTRHDGGHGLRFCPESLLVAVHRRIVHLVRRS